MKNIVIEEELEGKEAFLAGVAKGDNPYLESLAGDAWNVGWEAGKDESNDFVGLG